MFSPENIAAVRDTAGIDDARKKLWNTPALSSMSLRETRGGVFDFTVEIDFFFINDCNSPPPNDPSCGS